MSPSFELIPVVSVILLTIDRPQYIVGAIESVRQQTFSAWELVIVHDGPDPRVAAVVKPWMERDPRVRYFHRETIGNIANAINFGIHRSRGEYIAILDDDDAWIGPKKLELQLTCLRSSPTFAAVGGGAIVVDHIGQETMRYKRPMDPAECVRKALVANPIIHSTVLYRRDVAESVGLYDESLAGYQDWDLWLKMMRGHSVTNLSDYFATYRVWDGGGSSRKVLGNAWSAIRIVVRHAPHYSRVTSAFTISVLYFFFALLPSRIRRPLYQSMTRLKKRIFSD